MAVLPPSSLVIPAAGESSRLPGRQRKSYRDLAGRPLLLRTLEAFQNRDQGMGFIREIVLLVHPRELEKLKRDWRKPLEALKVSCILAGGSTRAHSVALGVLATSPSSQLVLIHDAARPLVTPAEIRAVAQAAWKRGAAILALEAFETVKKVSPQGRILKTLPRNELWLAQTPQAFRRSWIHTSCKRWLQEGMRSPPTDDAGFLEGRRPVWVVPGSGGNLKVTTPQDLRRARILWNLSHEAPCKVFH